MVSRLSRLEGGVSTTMERPREASDRMPPAPNRTLYPRRYTWRLYPTAPQAEALRQQARMVAMLWNALLERHETIRRRNR